MYLRGSAAIKRYINRDIHDYDIYMTDKEIKDFLYKHKYLKYRYKLGRYFIEDYFSKTLEVTILDDTEYGQELLKILDNKECEECFLEDKLLVKILPDEISFLEKLAHANVNMKKKWKDDLESLSQYFDKNIVSRKYKKLLDLAIIKNKSDIKKYILSKYYKKQIEINIPQNFTLDSFYKLLNHSKSTAQIIWIISFVYNQWYFRDYINKNFDYFY